MVGYATGYHSYLFTEFLDVVAFLQRQQIIVAVVLRVRQTRNNFTVKKLPAET